MFTEEEEKFIKSVFSQISVSAAEPTSMETISLVQSILSKLNIEPIEKPIEESK